jgi:hypothetical protein
MAKRKPLPHITPPDPAQIIMAGVAPVSIGERLGWLANQSMQPRRAQRLLSLSKDRHRILEPDAQPA